MTVPENPLMLATSISAFAVNPCWTFCDAGFACIVKSGVTAPPNVAV